MESLRPSAIQKYTNSPIDIFYFHIEVCLHFVDIYHIISKRSNSASESVFSFDMSVSKPPLSSPKNTKITSLFELKLIKFIDL